LWLDLSDFILFFVVDGIEIWDHLEIFIYWMKVHSKKCFLAFLNNKWILLLLLKKIINI
jgi:hypothetical protein